MDQRVEAIAGANLAEVRVRVGGVDVGICTNRPTLLPSLLERLPAGWVAVEAAAVARTYVLWAEKAPFRLAADHARVIEATDLEVVLDAFVADLESFTVARRG